MLFVLGIIVGTLLALPVLAFFTGSRILRLEETISTLRAAASEDQCRK